MPLCEDQVCQIIAINRRDARDYMGRNQCVLLGRTKSPKDGPFPLSQDGVWSTMDKFLMKQVCAIGAAIVVALALCTTNVCGLSFELKESLPIPGEGHRYLAGVEDLDGDGALDAVLYSPNNSAVSIVERTAIGWVERRSISGYPNLVRVEDVDGDGRAEILTSDDYTITIREATADNAYAVLYKRTYGFHIEGTGSTGDYDGDGMKEFLIAREGWPSTVHILEGTADNTYQNVDTVTGDEYNCNAVGTADLDCDGVMELVFWDSAYNAGAANDGTTYGYENGARAYKIDDFAALYNGGASGVPPLGDTDGNGKIEIIGHTLTPDHPSFPDPSQPPDLRFYEAVGDNMLVEVAYIPAPYEYEATDFDLDGQTELYQRRNYTLNVFRRSGNTLTEIWNSGTMFHGISAGIMSLLPIPDSDGNGASEVAVLQGQTMHILELQVDDPPVSRALRFPLRSRD